jgi:hypothetical protein
MTDYAAGLSGPRRPRPGPPPPTADQLHGRQLAARLVDHNNGRYGVFRGTNGTLALAWQVPPAGTPIGPLPTFIAPLRIEPQGDRNVLAILPAPAADDGSVTFAAPGQWIVRIDDEAGTTHVVDQRAFINAMTYVGPPPELRDAVPQPQAAPLVAEDEPEEQEEAPAPETHPEGAQARLDVVLLQEVRQAVAEIRGRVSAMVDHQVAVPTMHVVLDAFVREVLGDNERLRHEIKANAERHAVEAHELRNELGKTTRFLQAYLLELPGHEISVNWDHWQGVALPELKWSEVNYGFETIVRALVPEPRRPVEDVVDAIHREHVDPPAEAPQADAKPARPRRERKVTPSEGG